MGRMVRALGHTLLFILDRGFDRRGSSSAQGGALFGPREAGALVPLGLGSHGLPFADVDLLLGSVADVVAYPEGRSPFRLARVALSQGPPSWPGRVVEELGGLLWELGEK